MLTRALGPEQFGIYAVAIGLLPALAALAVDPTSNAIRRFYAAARERGEPTQLLRGVFHLALALALVLVAVGLLVSLSVTGLAHLAQWRSALVAMVLAAGAFVVFQYLLTTLYVRELQGRTATAQVVHSVLKTAGLAIGAVVLGSASGSLFGYVVALALLSVWMLRNLPRVAVPLVDKEQWRRCVAYGVPLYAMSLSWVLLVSLDRLALATFAGPKSAGQYTAVYLVAEGSVSFVALLLNYAVYPSLITGWERSDPAGVRTRLRLAVDVFVIVAVTVIAVLGVLGGELGRFVGGPGFSVPGVVPLLVGLGLLFSRLAEFEAIGFQLTLKTRALGLTWAMAASGSAVITVAGVVADGVRGAAIGTAVSYALLWAIVRMRGPIRDVTGYPLSRLWRPLLAAGGVALAASALPIEASLVAVCILVPPLAALTLGRRPRELSHLVGGLAHARRAGS